MSPPLPCVVHIYFIFMQFTFGNFRHCTPGIEKPWIRRCVRLKMKSIFFSMLCLIVSICKNFLLWPIRRPQKERNSMILWKEQNVIFKNTNQILFLCFLDVWSSVCIEWIWIPMIQRYLWETWSSSKRNMKLGLTKNYLLMCELLFLFLLHLYIEEFKMNV